MPDDSVDLWCDALAIPDFRYRLYDLVDAPNPFNYYGMFPDPAAEPLD